MRISQLNLEFSNSASLVIQIAQETSSICLNHSALAWCVCGGRAESQLQPFNICLMSTLPIESFPCPLYVDTQLTHMSPVSNSIQVNSLLFSDGLSSLVQSPTTLYCPHIETKFWSSYVSLNVLLLSTIQLR